MPKKTIVTCSGGLDSVGLLWKLLHETDEEILVQHIKIKCFWEHWEAEEAAFLNCMEYIKTHSRPFVVLPMMEYRSKGIAPYRPVGAFCGTMAALEHNADRVVRATVKVDVEARNRSPIHRNLYDVMIKATELLTKDTNIVYERPVTDVDKRDWFSLMPEELTDMVTPCFRPSLIDGKWIDCDTCYSCLRHAEGKVGTSPTHGDSWDREIMQYKRPLNIRRLYGKDVVIHYIEPRQENIEHLWHLLTETDINVVVQPIEIKDFNYRTPDMTNVIEYIKNNTRDFVLLHPTRFILPCNMDDRLRELAKVFCIGNLTRVYRAYISNIALTYSLDPTIKEECESLIYSYNFMKEIAINNTANTQCTLPADLSVILNATVNDN